jgi:predicted 3-demethylubiquinone-9 3-methyltransferase (glyoxalase superfamily)
MVIGQKIAPCIWFDNQGEEAAKFYVSIFKNSRIRHINRYGEAGKEIHGRPAGSVMTVEFELDGQLFTALNGGPMFKLSEAVSLQVYAENQEELDYYWDRLSAGGNPESQVCGWLKDKFGLSWQVVPRSLVEMFGDPANPGSQRAMAALLEMKKLDIAALEKAYRG